MFNILTELKEMIKMQGGDPTQIRDIGIAVMELKKLMSSRRSVPASTSSNASEHEWKPRRERDRKVEEY